MEVDPFLIRLSDEDAALTATVIVALGDPKQKIWESWAQIPDL